MNVVRLAKYAAVSLIAFAAIHCDRAKSEINELTDSNGDTPEELYKSKCNNVSYPHVREFKNLKLTSLSMYKNNLKLYSKNGNIIYDNNYTNNWPTLIKYNEHLIGIFHSCGSPCNFTLFFNPDTGEISPEALFWVMAVDPDKGLVIYSDDKKIIIENIFNPKLFSYSVKRDYSPTGHMGKACFIDSEKILLQYQAGENYQYITEILDLKNLH